MKKLLLLASLFIISSVSWAASLSPMNKDQVSTAITDKTLTTISAATVDNKIIADSFTGYFGKDGKMNGKFATQPADGSPQADQGTWKIKSDGMACVTWNHWNNGKEKCVMFYKLSNALLVVNSNLGFESLILTDTIKSGNQM